MNKSSNENERVEVFPLDPDGEVRAVLDHLDDLAVMNQTLIDAGTANQVLHFFHSHEGYPAGGFMAKLYSAMAHADQGNLYRLSQGFPAQVAAMRLASESPTGLDTLRKIARGGDAK